MSFQVGRGCLPLIITRQRLSDTRTIRARTARARATRMALEKVDGKKCYFRADKLLPREVLVWSHHAKQLDLDEGAVVKGRRHYKLQELKVIAAMERRMRSGRAALATKTKTNSAARLRRLWN
jgi:hypothetical protein